MRKLSVSVPGDVLAAAEQHVARGRAPSLSAYVTEALAARVGDDRRDTLLALLDEWDRELGPPSKEVRERTLRILRPREE
jgi:Arc/MetJ-type ribon-helix-helix transcriptional regulator